jgi:hypothetical protein
MSTQRTPWTFRRAQARLLPSPAPAQPGQGPSIAPGGIDVASFKAEGAPPFQGAELWAEIHSRALRHDGSDDSAFIATVTARLPCSTCRPHWLAFLGATPPDFGPGYFAWTVAAHNEVNTRLGKPIVSIGQAFGIWTARPPQPAQA